MFRDAKIGDQFKNRKGEYGVYCGMWQNIFHVVRFAKLGGLHYYNDGRYYEDHDSKHDIVEKVQDSDKKEKCDMPCYGVCSNDYCKCNVNHDSLLKLLY